MWSDVGHQGKIMYLIPNKKILKEANVVCVFFCVCVCIMASWEKTLSSEEKRVLIDQLETKITTLKAEIECVICLDERRDTLLKPCGHLAGCRECTKKLKECAICRTTIENTVAVEMLPPKRRLVRPNTHELYTKYDMAKWQ
jgi:hypothetical protein